VASDRQQFEWALARWRRLREAGRRSASWADGISAIVVSGFTDAPPGSPAADRELCAFRAEGDELADRAELAGGRPLLLAGATRADLDRAIQDPEVATLYIVGNGSLSMFWLAEDDRYDWLDVARQANHLKRGWVHQRQCGGLTRRLNVPLGLFALEQPARVIAALDDAFEPPTLDHPANECLTSVMTGWPVAYETFVLGGAFGRPQAATGFDDELGRTFARRLRQLRDVADGRGDEAATKLARTLLERFGWDAMTWIRAERRLLDLALADGPARTGSLAELAARLDLAHLNARYLRRLPVADPAGA